MRQSQKIKLDSITPLKTNLMMNNEFLSGQRGKYDIPSKSMQSIVLNNNYQAENCKKKLIKSCSNNFCCYEIIKWMKNILNQCRNLI